MTAKFRQWFYLLSGLVAAVVPILTALNLATQHQGEQWLSLFSVVGGLIGATGAGTAAVVVSKQRRAGTLDVVGPADQAITGIQATVAQVTNATAELDRVKQVATDALNAVPVLGPLAAQAIRNVLDHR